MNLTGKTVLVTGGSSGIGLALAREFSNLGNRMLICGRNLERMKALKAEIPDLGIYVCDMARHEAVTELGKTVSREHPELAILVNNAGIQHNYDFTHEADHSGLIIEELAVNLQSHILLTGSLLPTLLQQPSAAIVNVTSALALAPKRSAAVYCASKAAMRSFSKGLRYQLEDSPVSIFDLMPSLVDTPMTAGRGKGKVNAEYVATQTIRAMTRNRPEIRIAKSRLLYVLHRLAPRLAENIVKNS